MTRYQVVNEILTDRDTLCSQAVTIVKSHYPEYRIDTEKRVRELGLIVDAICYDIIEGTTAKTTKAGFGYIYYHNRFTFRKQRELVIYSVTVLRKLITDKIPQEDVHLRILINLKFDLLISIISDTTMTSAKWWDVAARTFPMIALSILFWIEIIGYSSWYHTFLIATATVFFAGGVVWWWWALRKIGSILVTLKQAQEKFQEVKLELKTVTKQLKKHSKTVDKSK